MIRYSKTRIATLFLSRFGLLWRKDTHHDSAGGANSHFDRGVQRQIPPSHSAGLVQCKELKRYRYPSVRVLTGGRRSGGYQNQRKHCSPSRKACVARKVLFAAEFCLARHLPHIGIDAAGGFLAVHSSCYLGSPAYNFRLYLDCKDSHALLRYRSFFANALKD